MILIEKSKRCLHLTDETGAVKMSCPISLGSCPQGHKLSEGDGRTVNFELYDLIPSFDMPADKIVKKETVAWITRAEDACLDKNEYKDSRPGGWRKCYKECGIDVVKLKKT